MAVTTGPVVSPKRLGPGHQNQTAGDLLGRGPEGFADAVEDKDVLHQEDQL